MPLYFLTFWKALSHCLDDIVWFCAIVFHWTDLVVIAESKVRVQVVWGVIELEITVEQWEWSSRMMA